MRNIDHKTDWREDSRRLATKRICQTSENFFITVEVSILSVPKTGSQFDLVEGFIYLEGLGFPISEGKKQQHRLEKAT